MLNEPVSPLSQVVETFLICDVVDQSATVGASVESVPEGLEFLLASGVPDLQSNNGIVDH